MGVIKIVYLDFDGVLHPSTPTNEGLFSRAALLEPAFENTRCSIVISSSWRFTHSLDNLRKKLPSFLAQRVVDTTGAAVIGKHARYQEITAHAYSHDDVILWRALDDSHWEFPVNCSELIHCNPNTGIGPKEITKLAAWLSNESI